MQKQLVDKNDAIFRLEASREEVGTALEKALSDASEQHKKLAEDRVEFQKRLEQKCGANERLLDELEAQKEAAKEIQSLVHEKENRILNLEVSLREAQSEKDQLFSEIESHKRAVREMQENIDEKEKELSALSEISNDKERQAAAAIEMKKEIETKNKIILDLELSMKNIRDESAELRNKICEFEETTKTLHRDTTDKDKRIAELEASKESVSRSLDEVQTEKSMKSDENDRIKAELQRKTQDNETLLNDLQSHKAAVDKLCSERTKLLEELANHKHQLEQSQEEKESIEASLHEAQQDIALKSRRIAALEVTKTALSETVEKASLELSTMTEASAGTRKLLKGKNDLNERLLDDIRSHKDDIAKKEAKVSELENAYKKIADELETMRSDMSNLVYKKAVLENAAKVKASEHDALVRDMSSKTAENQELLAELRDRDAKVAELEVTNRGLVQSNNECGDLIRQGMKENESLTQSLNSHIDKLKLIQKQSCEKDTKIAHLESSLTKACDDLVNTERAVSRLEEDKEYLQCKLNGCVQAMEGLQLVIDSLSTHNVVRHISLDSSQNSEELEEVRRQSTEEINELRHKLRVFEESKSSQESMKGPSFVNESKSVARAVTSNDDDDSLGQFEVVKRNMVEELIKLKQHIVAKDGEIADLLDSKDLLSDEIDRLQRNLQLLVEENKILNETSRLQSDEVAKLCEELNETKQQMIDIDMLKSESSKQAEKVRTELSLMKEENKCLKDDGKSNEVELCKVRELIQEKDARIVSMEQTHVEMSSKTTELEHTILSEKAATSQLKEDLKAHRMDLARLHVLLENRNKEIESIRLTKESLEDNLKKFQEVCSSKDRSIAQVEENAKKEALQARNELQEKVNTLEEQMQCIKNHLDSRTKNLVSTRHQLIQQDENIEQIREEIKKKDKMITDLQEMKDTPACDLSGYQEQIKAVTSENERLRDYVQNLQTEVNQLQQDVQEKTNTIQSLEGTKEKMDEALEWAMTERKQRERVEGERNDINKEYRDVQKKLETIDAENQTMKNELLSQNAAVDKLCKDNMDKSSKLSQLEKELQSIEEVQAKNEMLQTEVDQLNRQISELKDSSHHSSDSETSSSIRTRNECPHYQQ